MSSRMSSGRSRRAGRNGPVVRAAVFAGVVALALGVATCFTAVTPRSASAGRRHGSSVARAASEQLYMPDASPKGKEVMEAYKKLQGVKGEQEIADIINALEPDQRQRLKSLIEIRGGKEKEITTMDPELGDTPERLYRKLQKLDTDEEVLDWRKKIEPSMMQEVQILIEKEQMKLADEEGSQQLDDEAEAKQCYDLWRAQFPAPAEKEVFMTTPCRENDIKYRFRRLKENLDLDSETVLKIAEKDASPFVVDPDYIRRTWKALVQECDGDRIDALESLVLKHPGSLIANPTNLKGQIMQAKLTASVIDATSGINKFLRTIISDNGRRTPIGRRDEPAFGGGLPAWRRKWEQEERERKRKEQQEKEMAR